MLCQSLRIRRDHNVRYDTQRCFAPCDEAITRHSLLRPGREFSARSGVSQCSTHYGSRHYESNFGDSTTKSRILALRRNFGVHRGMMNMGCSSGAPACCAASQSQSCFGASIAKMPPNVRHDSSNFPEFHIGNMQQYVALKCAERSNRDSFHVSANESCDNAPHLQV